MFKVGKYYKCINDHSGYKLRTIGNYYVCTRIDNGCYYFQNNKNHDGYAMLGTRLQEFDINTERDDMPNKLEDLVKTYNDNLIKQNEILDTIKKEYPDKVLVTFFGANEAYNLKTLAYHKELVIKKEINTFVLHDSIYQVIIEGNVVKVGCKEFEKDDLLNALKQLVRNHGSSCSLNGGTLYAYRRGVSYGKNNITWDDAEQLLKELEK